MRILVLSDSHGRASLTKSVALKHAEIRNIFFLGDGLRDIETLPLLCPKAVIYRVSGNCDLFSGLPEEASVTLDGVKIFYCHGHTAGVKYGTEGIYRKAEAENAALLLYGHTHIPDISYKNGRVFVNPGSIGNPRNGRGSYAVIEIGENGIHPKIYTV